MLVGIVRDGHESAAESKVEPIKPAGTARSEMLVHEGCSRKARKRSLGKSAKLSLSNGCTEGSKKRSTVGYG